MGSKLTQLLRRLVGAERKGGPDASAGQAVDYEGYTIHPAPRREGSRWLTAGVITKPFGEEVREHHFIRAETHGSKQAADAFAIVKAKQIIDELGDNLFDGG